VDLFLAASCALRRPIFSLGRLIKPSETKAKSGSELTAGRSVSDKHNKFPRGSPSSQSASAQGSKNYGNWFFSTNVFI
jgi:hypothetical protein